MSNLKKTEIPKEIFKLLKIKWDKKYTSENTNSGGGGTFTRDGLDKIYERLQELENEGKLNP